MQPEQTFLEPKKWGKCIQSIYKGWLYVLSVENLGRNRLMYILTYY